MIIARTPFRISFVGGGSDLGAFYRQQPGAVVSTTIDKYMYVTVNERFDESIRVSYTQTEIVDKVKQIRHDLVREVMRLVGLDGGIEITTIADVPSGTGLGSSSSVTVGLLHAVHGFMGQFKSNEELAEEACHIEIERVGKPIGKQDQYAAAFGGLNHIRFNSDESVFVEPIICAPDTKELLDQRLLMFYTGLRGDNDELLKEQSDATTTQRSKQEVLSDMVGLADDMQAALSQDDLSRFGDLLHENWELKKQMASGISNPKIDRWYQAARDAGARGGKILGAGGGGFLMVYCEEGQQASVRSAMEDLGLPEYPFQLEPQGSTIVYVGR